MNTNEHEYYFRPDKSSSCHFLASIREYSCAFVAKILSRAGRRPLTIKSVSTSNLQSPDCEHSLGEMAICDTELDSRGSLQKPFIDAHVVFRHARGVKASFEQHPAATAIKTRQTSDRARRFLHLVDDETGAVFHNFRHGAVGPCDHRRAAGHRLDHHQAERLRPINREEQRIRPAQKFLLLLTADLADEFDQRGI